MRSTGPLRGFQLKKAGIVNKFAYKMGRRSMSNKASVESVRIRVKSPSTDSINLDSRTQIVSDTPPPQIGDSFAENWRSVETLCLTAEHSASLLLDLLSGATVSEMELIEVRGIGFYFFFGEAQILILNDTEIQDSFKQCITCQQQVLAQIINTKEPALVAKLLKASEAVTASLEKYAQWRKPSEKALQPKSFNESRGRPTLPIPPSINKSSNVIPYSVWSGDSR
ncbi:hypothetical protein BDR26DRAFT_15804 [Obelidium mucronatum]|nr:hypothetical protein BDR26DRAFT_15804 [Obelidium mucronatum]